MTATITRTEGVEAIVTAPFTWLVLVLIVAAPLVCAWLDRRSPRDPYALSDDVQAARDELRTAAAKGRQMRSERGNPYMTPWVRDGRAPGEMPEVER